MRKIHALQHYTDTCGTFLLVVVNSFVTISFFHTMKLRAEIESKVTNSDYPPFSKNKTYIALT